MFPLPVRNQAGGVRLCATVWGEQVAEGYSEVAQLVAVSILLPTLPVPELGALTAALWFASLRHGTVHETLR